LSRSGRAGFTSCSAKNSDTFLTCCTTQTLSEFAVIAVTWIRRVATLMKISTKPWTD
jgi:hypothetical protein